MNISDPRGVSRRGVFGVKISLFFLTYPCLKQRGHELTKKPSKKYPEYALVR